uniref:SPX domain-containing protein n=2 Tax=Chenopodium quinoa TaxID=63459 RepID=A0A803LSB4_CHEQI
MTLEEFQDWFVRLLNDELDKLNDFYVEKEEDFVIRFLELKERILRVREDRRDEIPASESEFSEEMMDIRKEFVTIHGEMVLLKNYSSLNFAGLVKILKKYDKRTGGLLRLPFTQLAAHQPFFTTEPLTRLVRECEANLELLFPLEEEVTESTSAPRDQNQVDPAVSDATNMPSDASSLGEASQDIYRSTLSAIKTIQGLRTSSTYNPLSFAVIFRDQNDEGSGAVTNENSPSNSSHAPPSENEETVDQADAGLTP